MVEAFICDYIRTPIAKFAGSLAAIRTDDLAALPLAALMDRHPHVDWHKVDDVIFGCSNQAGEDNRNIARMASLLAGLPETVPGTTINRLCGSGMDAILAASRAIKTGDADLILAGGVEGMSRAPFVIHKAQKAFSRTSAIEDTTIGWRFENPKMKASFGTDAMPVTAENVAAEFNISREDQDRFALSSQHKAARAIDNGRLGKEILSVTVPQQRADPVVFDRDEHPYPRTSMEALGRLATPFRTNGTITAGNASGINDGAAAMMLASSKAIEKYGLTPMARIVTGTTAGVAPRIMGIGPVPAIQKLLSRTQLSLKDFDIIELNEAFAAQCLACMRQLGIADDDPRVNPNGGAIALGHPLGMSGLRISGTAAIELREKKLYRALAAMCIGVGQGIAIALERVE